MVNSSPKIFSQDFASEKPLSRCRGDLIPGLRLGDAPAQVAKMEANNREHVREILTVRDVALELRCSVAHVYNVINGKVKNVSRLPAIAIGGRKLIQRDTLEE
jgi:ABC-type molybdate transport system ATPase subunit